MKKTLTEHDAEYWNNYYSKKVAPTGPSSFAVYVAEQLDDPTALIDLGCGNGRDSVYFCDRGHTVFCLDPSVEAIKNAREITGDRAIPINADGSKLSATTPWVDVIYSRFSLHSMDEDSYKKTLVFIKNSLKKGGSLWIEVRSTKDELYQEGEQVDKRTYKTDHGRRFFTLDSLVSDLDKLNFKINMAKESRGWAVFEGEDPVVIRVHCTK
jgi:cyclopropane fatty-acyl-phospholipid synthase-like methyltransferase